MEQNKEIAPEELLQSIMNENNSSKINEEQLADVAGGEGLSGMCLFTPSGEKKQDSNRNFDWIKCKSNCTVFCCCYGEEHCVDNWHIIDSGNYRLYPDGFANHDNKSPYNDYNT